MLNDHEYASMTVVVARRRRRKGLESARQQRLRRKRWLRQHRARARGR